MYHTVNKNDFCKVYIITNWLLSPYKLELISKKIFLHLRVVMSLGQNYTVSQLPSQHLSSSLLHSKLLFILFTVFFKELVRRNEWYSGFSWKLLVHVSTQVWSKGNCLCITYLKSKSFLCKLGSLLFSLVPLFSK